MRKIGFFSVLSICLWSANGQDLGKPGTIEVTGVGVVSVLPDRVDLKFEMSSREKEATAALEASNKSVRKILQSIKDSGIPDSNVSTSNFLVNPNQEYENGKPGKWYYVASSSLYIKLNDIYSVGKVIDKLLSDGTRSINTPIFRSSVEDSLRNEAYKKAVNDAQAKAQKLAESFGVALGKPLQISADMGDIEPRKYYYDRGIMALEAGTVIMPYYVTKQVTVKVTFEILESIKK